MESRELVATTSLDLVLAWLLLDGETFLPLLLVFLGLTCGTKVDKSNRLAR